MRLLSVALVAVTVLYLWDNMQNSSKLADGLVRMVGSIARSFR